MNKSELVDALSRATELSKRAAGEALDAVLGIIQSTVASNEKVTIPGFGTFELRSRAARMARNPQTGATIKVPATKAPAFKAGAEFKQAAKGGKKKAAAKPKPKKR